MVTGSFFCGCVVVGKTFFLMVLFKIHPQKFWFVFLMLVSKKMGFISRSFVLFFDEFQAV